MEADFSGGHLSSNGGTLFLREIDERLELSSRLSGCFRDLRDQRYVEHRLPALIAQRVHGLALGHEDLNDHDALRVDPLFAVSCGREDVLGEERRSEPEPGKPLAGKSTLNRLELGAEDGKGHYRKIQPNADKIRDLLLTMGVEAIPAKSKVNPRFIVTEITGEEPWAKDDPLFQNGRCLYENFYCSRGDMENRIKEQQLDMFADRTSTSHMTSNQLRLWFSTFAYMLVDHLQAFALRGTRLAKSTVGSISLHLMKIAAHITVSVRRIYVRLASSCPMADVFAQAHHELLSRAGPGSG